MGSTSLENTLVTGADGMVGSYVDFGIKTARDTLDVTDRGAVRKFCVEHRPSVILHLAAATDLARCEREPEYAHRINAVGTYNVALAARHIGAKLVHVSTSSVFDGTKLDAYTEADTPSPLNEYGHSKYLGELAVAGTLDDYIIARVTWVFGGGSGKDVKFVSKVMSQLNEPVIKAVADKRASPTYGKDAVEHIKRLITNNARGLYHIPNAGVATRADIAREIVTITGSRSRIEEVAESSFKPQYPSGDNEAMASLKIKPLRSWQEALREYIATEWSDVIQK